MSWINQNETYGWFTIGLHWLVALGVFGLFFLGDYMVDLTYYQTWYHRAPALHKAFGMIVFALLMLRIGWHLVSRPPPPLPALKVWERVSAGMVHKLLYALVLLTIASGYLMTTAEGQGVSVFGWFEVPALPLAVRQQADLAGKVHDASAHVLVFLAVGHALAALKHHFVDKDRTLLRMLVSR